MNDIIDFFTNKKDIFVVRELYKEYLCPEIRHVNILGENIKYDAVRIHEEGHIVTVLLLLKNKAVALLGSGKQFNIEVLDAKSSVKKLITAHFDFITIHREHDFALFVENIYMLQNTIYGDIVGIKKPGQTAYAY